MLSRQSIQTRLMRVILITSGAVLLLTFTSFFVYEFISYRQLTLQHLSTLGQIVATNSTASLAFDDAEDAQEILRGFVADERVEAACIYKQDGTIFAKYPANEPLTSFPLEPGGGGFELHSNDFSGFLPIVENHKILGTLYLKANISDVKRRVATYSVVAVVVMALAFGLAYILSRQLQKNISIPIVSLAVTARMVSDHHDYSVRASKLSDDEVGLLTDAFNHMLTQIERQNREILEGQRSLKEYADQLEAKVQERTREYKEQRDFIETVVESSLDIICVYDTEGRILNINKKFEEQYGLTKAQVIGKTLPEIFPAAHLAHGQLMRALKGELIHNREFKSSVMDKYFESFVIPMKNERGEVYAALTTAHDITERVKASEKLKSVADQLQRANESLTRKNNELEQFAYVASHDLQEPLRKIQTFIELAKRSYLDEVNAKRYMDKVELSAARMSALIKDVLDYSRLGQPVDGIEPTDLNTVLDNVKSDFELVISQKEAVIESDALPVVHGHRLQLNQLFANLISNALKFTRGKPVVSITAQRVEGVSRAVKDLDPQKSYWCIAFKDNGIGFEQYLADKIFTIFQRLNTREKFEGTGIGLALCKKIVENHGGYIIANSTPGVGTTFTVYLPVAE
jgi:PAS domain S-box-containing protein